MQKKYRLIALMGALAVILAVGLAAQQKVADTAVDPVCGMTVVKANAKATFDYKGTTYYFCSTNCKESFAKEPEKYLKAQADKAAAKTPAPMGAMGQMGMMGHGQGMGQGMAGQGMAACPMMGSNMQMGAGIGQMGMRHRGTMGRPGRPMMAPGLAQLWRLYGDKIEVTVENSKDGASLKITSKDPEVAKAIQVHMAEHLTMMKKMQEAAKADTPTAKK
jgi:YHS domain-containing protein